MPHGTPPLIWVVIQSHRQKLAVVTGMAPYVGKSDMTCFNLSNAPAQPFQIIATASWPSQASEQAVRQPTDACFDHVSMLGDATAC